MSKLQIPTSKLQRNFKNQSSNKRSPLPDASLGPGVWRLKFSFHRFKTKTARHSDMEKRAALS
jgi:hypothetical protein